MKHILFIILISSLSFYSCNGSKTSETSKKESLSESAELTKSVVEIEEKDSLVIMHNFFTVGGRLVSAVLKESRIEKVWEFKNAYLIDSAYAKVPLSGGGNIELLVPHNNEEKEENILNLKLKFDSDAEEKAELVLVEIDRLIKPAFTGEHLYGDRFRLIFILPDNSGVFDGPLLYFAEE